ncbi:MAG: hypothetical protein WCE58_11975, partial [Gallionella sp.]
LQAMRVDFYHPDATGFFSNFPIEFLLVTISQLVTFFQFSSSQSPFAHRYAPIRPEIKTRH